jgi:hypothetical protein
MRKNRVVEQNRCYHLVSRLAHRAFFLDDEEKDRAVALMRRVEAGVKASMSYCINRAVSISSDPFDPYNYHYNSNAGKETPANYSEYYSAPVWKQFGGRL